MSRRSTDVLSLPGNVVVIGDSDDDISLRSVIFAKELGKPAALAVTPRVIEVVNLVDSEDDNSDDDSVSMQSVTSALIAAEEPYSFLSAYGRSLTDTDDTAMEFMSKGLWIAGQENAEMADAKGTYRRYPPTLLGLNRQQVEMCSRDAQFYYNKYAETIFVKELQEMIAPGRPGFKEIRQRTAGRYDMQIPTFDTDKFYFLNDPDASWMPLVRKFLSHTKCALIHKGIILSMGKSERQKYHIDGIHLHPSEHKPCYAVNVFFYLVDIDKKNGGTEFYVGSHKIHEQDLDIGRAIRPLVEAGQPIIFDYRLGHLGLENNTEDIRPMLYLTYTGIGSDGEVIFRDDKNFDETLPSLEFEEGLLPDRPDSGERARRRAILTM